MPTFTTREIRQLRQLSGAGMMRCKHALEASSGSVADAAAALRREGLVKAEQLTQRETRQGVIGSYVHHNGRLAAMVELNCETDFVARTTVLQALARQLAEHIAGAAPLAVDEKAIPSELLARKLVQFKDEVRATGKPDGMIAPVVQGKLESWLGEAVLLKQRWVREPSITIAELIGEASAKLGEHLHVRRFSRMELAGEAEPTIETTSAPGPLGSGGEGEHAD